MVRGVTAGLAARVAVVATVGRVAAFCFGEVPTAASPEKSSPGAGSSPGSGNMPAGLMATGGLIARAEKFGALSEPGVVGRLFDRRIKKYIPPAIPIDRHVINTPISKPLPPDSSGFATVAAALATGASCVASSATSGSATVSAATEARSRGIGAIPLSDCKSWYSRSNFAKEASSRSPYTCTKLVTSANAEFRCLSLFGAFVFAYRRRLLVS